MLNIFVACPYVPEPIPDYRDAFRAVSKDRNFVRFIFSDERISSDMILSKIREDMESATICLCDMTGWNPNVCLEFGLALGLNKTVHILYHQQDKKTIWPWTRAGTTPNDLPVDVRGFDRINYRTLAELQTGIGRIVEQAIMTPDPTAGRQAFEFMCEKVLALVKTERALKSWEIAQRLDVQTPEVRSALDTLLRTRRIERRGRYSNTLFFEFGTAPNETALKSPDLLQPPEVDENSDSPQP